MSATSPATPVAFVTGGARGIGLACGRWFLDHGYHVALIDIDVATLARTDAELTDPQRVLTVHADVSKPDQVDAAVARVDIEVPKQASGVVKRELGQRFLDLQITRHGVAPLGDRIGAIVGLTGAIYAKAIGRRTIPAHEVRISTRPRGSRVGCINGGTSGGRTTRGVDDRMAVAESLPTEFTDNIATDALCDPIAVSSGRNLAVEGGL